MDSKGNKSRSDSNNGLPAAYAFAQERKYNRNEQSPPPLTFRQNPRYSSSLCRPYLRSGRALSSRFNSRGRFFHVPYHSRPDISPQRNNSKRTSSRQSVTREERSPRSHRYRSRSRSIIREKRSHSPLWPRGGRAGFRGSNSRASRHSAIIGNFGCPIYHKPDYDVSPDRTGGDASKGKIEDRDEIFQKMMESKKSENLDQYYRYRDMLNEFDRRNREGIMKRRHSSSKTDRAVDDQELKRMKKGKREYDERKDCIREELEEIDCSVHDDFEKKDQVVENTSSDNKKHRKHETDHSKKEKPEFHDEQQYDEEAEKQPSADDELDYDDKMLDDNKQNDEDLYEYEDEFGDEEINFDLIENGASLEEKAPRNQIEHIAHEYQQRREQSVQTIPIKTSIRDFLPLLQTSIANGLSIALAEIGKKRWISVSSQSQMNSGKISKNKKGRKYSKSPNAINGNAGLEQQLTDQRKKDSNSNDLITNNKPIQSLMELSLTKFVAETASKLLNASLMKSNDE